MSTIRATYFVGALIGTYIGSIVSPTYGGTGVNNGSNTLTLGSSVSIDQDLTTTSTPKFASVFADTFQQGTTNQAVVLLQNSGTSVAANALQLLSASGGILIGAALNKNTNITTAGTGKATVNNDEIATLTATQTMTNKTFTAPVLGTPASGTLTNCTGLPMTTGVTGILPAANGGTGVNNGTFTLTIGANSSVNQNVSSSGNPVFNAMTASSRSILFGGTNSTTVTGPSSGGSITITLPTIADTLVGRTTTDTLSNKTLVAPALGTPASGVLTNCTGLPMTTGVSGILAATNGGTGVNNGANTLTVNAASTIDQNVSTTAAPTHTSLSLTNPGNQLTFFTGTQKTTVNVPVPASNITVSFPGVATNLIGDDTSNILTNKIWNSALILPAYGGTGANNGANTILVTAPSSLNQDLRTTASPTYASLSLSNTTNQLVFGTGTQKTTLTSPAPASNVTLTLPIIADTLVGQTTTDTLSNKTLVAPALGTPASGTLTNCTGLPLTTGVTGALGVTNGGTSQTSWSAGDILYGSGVNTVNRLTGNITATNKFLRSHGSGSNALPPAWVTLTKTDVGLSAVENTALSTWTGSSSITTLGTVTTCGGITIQNAGISGYVPTSFSAYEEYSATGTTSGSLAVAFSIKFTRIGNQVTFAIMTQMGGTGSASGLGFGASAFPVRFCPTVAGQSFPYFIKDNGSWVTRIIQINGNGNFFVLTNNDGAPLTGGAQIFPPSSFTYLI